MKTLEQNVKVNFARFDVWVTYRDNKRELYDSTSNYKSLLKLVESRKFKKLLKKITRVEVLQVFDKNIRNINQTLEVVESQTDTVSIER